MYGIETPLVLGRTQVIDYCQQIEIVGNVAFIITTTAKQKYRQGLNHVRTKWTL